MKLSFCTYTSTYLLVIILIQSTSSNSLVQCAPIPQPFFQLAAVGASIAATAARFGASAAQIGMAAGAAARTAVMTVPRLVTSALSAGRVGQAAGQMSVAMRSAFSGAPALLTRAGTAAGTVARSTGNLGKSALAAIKAKPLEIGNIALMVGMTVPGIAMLPKQIQGANANTAVAKQQSELINAQAKAAGLTLGGGTTATGSATSFSSSGLIKMLAQGLSLLVALGYVMCLNYNILEPYANSKFYPTANAQIKWRLDNVSLPFPNPDIRIHLYNEKQKFLMEIDSYVGNTGLYEWTIPSDLMYSAHYQGLRVCIDSVTPGDIEGCSEIFYLQSYLEEPRQLDLSVEGIEAATVYVEEELNTKFSKLSSFPELPWGVNFEMHVPSKGAEAHVGKSVTLARNVSFGNSYEGNVKLKVPTLEQWGNIPKDKNAGDDTFDAELFAYGYNTKKSSLVYGSLPVRVAYQIPLKLRFISVDSTTVWETEKVQSLVMGLCAQDDDSVVRNRDIRLSMWFVNDKNEKVGDVLVNKEVFRHDMTSGVFSIKFTLKNDSIVWKSLESASSFSGGDQKVFSQEAKVESKKVRLVYSAEYNVNINNGKSHDRWIKLEGYSDQFFLKYNQKDKSAAVNLAPSLVSYAVSIACIIGVVLV